MNQPLRIQASDLAGYVARAKKSARTRARQTEARKPTGPMRTTPVQFIVEGKPKGKGRPRFSFKGGHAYTPASTVAYERQIKSAARMAMDNHQPMDGPVAVSVVAWFPIPTSWPKYRQDAARTGVLLPMVKPDADNALKAILDSCNHVCFTDDAHVVEATITKRYGDMPRLQIQVSPIKPAHPHGDEHASSTSPSDSRSPDLRPQNPPSPESIRS